MKRWIQMVCMGLLVVSLTACGQKAPVEVLSDAIAVEVWTVETKSLERHTSFSATATAMREVNLVAGLSGEVIEKLVNVGEAVEKDQVLLKLDTENVARAMEQAKSAYNLARVNYDSAVSRHEDAVTNLARNQQLYLEGAISKSQLEQLESAASDFSVDGARLQLEQAKLAYESAVSTSDGAGIKAPFKGVIATLNPDVGSVVAPGAPIGTLVDLESLKLEFHVSEQLINQITFDTPVTLSFPAQADVTIEGKISAVSPVADPMSKLYAVEVQFQNPSGVIRPGMFASVDLNLTDEAAKVLVPYDAVLYSEEGYYVYIVKDDAPVMQLVTLGQDNGIDIEIIEGLQVGDQLIVKGQAYVKQDSTLNIVKGE